VHLVVVITPHGYGHAAQVAPVLNALQLQINDLQLTILSTLPEEFLRSRIDGEFKYINHAADFGLKMKSSLEIDLVSSAETYKELHTNWKYIVDAEYEFLARLEPDCILADVPYLTLAAASKLGVPVYAMCSLNWADIYRHYFSTRPEAEGILAEMTAAYQQADVFYCPQPAMPMSWLNNRYQVGPIAGKGLNKREAILRSLELPDKQRLVVVAPGGVSTRLPMENWPRSAGVSWLVKDASACDHPDIYEINDVPLSFTDLLASVDLVLGKCGYGTVAECVVNGTPLLYIPRPDWPEEAYLLDWMERRNACLPIGKNKLENGDMLDVIEACSQLEVDTVNATGALEVANEICSRNE
jgi:hypothetical protein